MTSGSLLSHIVVGVDGSTASLDALREAVRLADVFDADVEAVCAVEPLVLFKGYYPIDYPPPGDQARQILRDAVARAFPQGAPQRLTLTALEARASTALIEASGRADLLVVGSRGHGGFTGLLLGSVSSACVSHSRCSVLVVRPPARASATS